MEDDDFNQGVLGNDDGGELYVGITVEANATLTDAQMTQIDADIFGFDWPDGVGVESVRFVWEVGEVTQWEATIMIDPQTLDADADEAEAVALTGIMAVVEATPCYADSMLA